jgi:hypothetical protein
LLCSYFSLAYFPSRRSAALCLQFFAWQWLLLASGWSWFGCRR